MPAKARTMVELAHGEGTGGNHGLDDDALVLLCHGDVIDEPVVAYGPFVMNTEEEIRRRAGPRGGRSAGLIRVAPFCLRGSCGCRR